MEKRLNEKKTRQEGQSSDASSGKNKSCKYWAVVMDGEKPNAGSASADKSQVRNPTTTDGKKEMNTLGKNAPKPNGSKVSVLKPVPIAPNGPIVQPQYDPDEPHFACKYEGCQRRYKHQPSLCRHVKQSHKK